MIKSGLQAGGWEGGGETWRQSVDIGLTGSVACKKGKAEDEGELEDEDDSKGCARSWAMRCGSPISFRSYAGSSAKRREQ
jgi:hypothetical protein